MSWRRPPAEQAVRPQAPGLGRLSVSWLLLGAIVVLLGAAFLYWRSDTWRLERRLTQLERLISKEEDEAPLPAAAKSRQLVAFFATGFVIRAHTYDTVVADPDELSSAIHTYRSASGWIHLSLHDRDIEIEGRPPTASVGFTATVDRELAGGVARERYYIRSRWVKEEGEWLIRELDLLEVEVSPDHPLYGVR